MEVLKFWMIGARIQILQFSSPIFPLSAVASNDDASPRFDSSPDWLLGNKMTMNHEIQSRLRCGGSSIPEMLCPVRG